MGLFNNMGFLKHGFPVVFLRSGSTVKLYVSVRVVLQSCIFLSPKPWPKTLVKNLAKNLVKNKEHTKNTLRRSIIVPGG